MSVTFSIGKEEIGEFEGTPRIFYKNVYPEGFDNTPTVDPDFPECGDMMYPDNPWEVNLSNGNACEMLRTFGLSMNEDYCGVICGTDLSKVLEVSKESLAVINSVPEMDNGTETQIYKTENGPTVYACGHIPGYYTNRFSKFLELAGIALENNYVIFFA